MKNNSRVESFDEIVFEERNKKYGAYVIRKSYDKRVTLSLAFSFFFILLLVGYPVIASYLNNSSREIKLTKESIMQVDEYKKEADLLPPPPAPEPESMKDLVKQVKYTTLLVVDSMDQEPDFLTKDELLASTDNSNLSTGTKIEKLVEELDDVKIVKEEKICTFVEEMPSYPGGEIALQKFISTHVVYPAAARELGLKGKIYVRFVVTSLGTVDQVQILRGVDPLLDVEAIKVVKSLENWKPGRQQGEAVSVWYTVPINFQIAEQ